MAGQHVGSYQLVTEIGHGGMGSVWAAKHQSLGRRVAVKFIDAKCDGQDARRRFEREAVAAARIRSRHVVHVYDHGIDDDRPYIVMELLCGESLGARLGRKSILSPGAALHILTDIGRALTRAHAEGVVHRDLKPDNVFLCKDEDTGDEYAKVLDFGIAKVIRGQQEELSMSASDNRSKTQTGTLLGTPYYMSPEQARGATDIDARSDLWALGVMACQCLTGSLPFVGASLGDLLVKICTVPPTLTSHLHPDLPPTLDTWILHALEKDPKQRFQHAADMTSELARALGLDASSPRGTSSLQAEPTVLYGAGNTLPLSTPLIAAIDPHVLSRLPKVRTPFRKRALYTLSFSGLVLSGVGLWMAWPNLSRAVNTSAAIHMATEPQSAVMLEDAAPVFVAASVMEPAPLARDAGAAPLSPSRPSSKPRPANVDEPPGF